MHALDLIAHRLVKEGYGSWDEVNRMPVDAAMEAYNYIQFLADYSDTSLELNRADESR